MQEIRFGQYADKPKDINNTENMAQNKAKKSFNLKNILKAFLVVLVVLVLVFLAIFARDKFFNFSKSQNEKYGAVFLINNQVYFGKIIKNNSEEMILNDVFYIQLNENLSTEQNGAITTTNGRFNLVKLGNEIHGPTDELYINKDNVIFYEYLRDDSSVVQSIINYKQK